MQGILESLGWAILHSFWQMALIWLAYQVLFGTHRKVSPLVRHHAAVAAMFIGTAWFIATFIEQYHIYVSIERYLALVPETSAQASPLAAATMSVNALYLALKTFAAGHIAWLSAIYLCMLALMCWKLLQGYLQVHTLRSEGLFPAGPYLQQQVAQLAGKLSVPFPVRVHLSQLVDVPATLGVLKPVILLPAACVTQLSPAQLESILLHELAHIRRMDYLVNIAVGLMETLLLHNPFAWWFARSIRREREWCCDDIVLSQRQDAIEYAAALLSLEQQRRLPAMAMAMASNGQQGQLLQRIRRITSSPATKIAQPHRLMAVGLMILLMMLMAWTRPGQLQAGSYDAIAGKREISRVILAQAPQDLTRQPEQSQILTESYKRKNTDIRRPFYDEAQEGPVMEDMEQEFLIQSAPQVFVNQPPPESFTFTYTHPAEGDVLFVVPATPPLPPAVPGGMPEHLQQRTMTLDQHIMMEKDLEALHSQQEALEQMIQAELEQAQRLKAFSKSRGKRPSAPERPDAPEAASQRIFMQNAIPHTSIERVFSSSSLDPQVWQELQYVREPLKELRRERVPGRTSREMVKVNRIKTRDGYTLRIVTEKESIDIRIGEDDIVVEKD
jgi:beta-lactamase regulating signal transducer with metallopeptidase domain